MNRLTRGNLARQSSVNIATIRYYEKLGLLPAPPRSNAGYRMFSSESVGRVRFIKHAQELGFSLKEIKELLDLRVAPNATTTDVRTRAKEKIAKIGEKIRSLSAIRKSLESLVNSCCGIGSVSECPILDSLASEENRSESREIKI